MTNPNVVIDAEQSNTKDTGRLLDVARKVGQAIGIQYIVQEPLQPALPPRPAIDLDNDDFLQNHLKNSPQTD